MSSHPQYHSYTSLRMLLTLSTPEALQANRENIQTMYYNACKAYDETPPAERETLFNLEIFRTIEDKVLHIPEKQRVNE